MIFRKIEVFGFKSFADKLEIDLSGGVTAIVGPNGCGKTTIIELINGLILPTSGEVIVGDVILQNKKRPKNINELRSNVGLVYQNPEVQFFCKTVRKEIEFALKNFNYKTEEKEKRISDALKMVGLDDSYLERSPFKLSKGEQRKVAIALILAFNPKIIIMDEPTMGLDASSRKHLIKLIKMMKIRYDKTIILVTTDTDMLHGVADYIYIVNEGRIARAGDKYEIFSDSNILKQYRIKCPKIVEFSNLVETKKGIKIGYRDDISDLMKDVYRYVK